MLDAQTYGSWAGGIPFDESIAACRKQPDAVYDFPPDDGVVLEKRFVGCLVCLCTRLHVESLPG